MDNDLTSCYELWEILESQCDVRDEEYVKQKLQENRDRLLNGLTSFIKPSTASKEKFEKETNIKPLRKEFALKLSKFLNIEELQSLKLFHGYLQHSFRESKEQLQDVLRNEIHTETLLIKVMEYYFEERISILKCLETILSLSQRPSHPYQETFSTFLDDLMKDGELLRQVWSQYKVCCKTTIHLPVGDELDMVKRHSHRFSQQLLQEQISVLRLIFLLYKTFENSTETFSEAVKLFQSQGFGTRQLNRHSFDGFTKLMITQIGFLQVMILVEGMKLSSLVKCVEQERTEDHSLFKQLTIMKELEEIFVKWGALVHHGPVMLAWAAVRFVLMGEDGETPTVVQRMGSRALQCGVFPYLLNLMKSAPFNEDTVLLSIARSTIYDLLSVVLTLFHESTLGDPLMLIAVLKETLQSSELCGKFWKSELESGMAMLLKSAKRNFPYRFTPFTQIMTSLAKDKTSSENVFNFLRNMKTYTELSKVNSLDDVDCIDSDETSWKLLNAKILYKSVVSTADKIVIPTGTLGKVYVSNEGAHLLRWSFNYSCWQLFLLELDVFLQFMPHSSDRERQNMVNKVLDIVEILNNVLLHNWSKVSSLVNLVDRVYYIVQKFSTNPNCPPELITTCVKCLTTVTHHEPVQSWLSLQQTGYLPFCVSSLKPNDKKIVISSVTVDPGHFGHFMSRERSHGFFPITIATLDLMKELVAIVSPAETKGGSGIDDFVACVVFACRDVFTGYQKWHYGDLKEKQEIGLKCLEIFHGILNLKESRTKMKTGDETFELSFHNESQEISIVTRLTEMLVDGLLCSDVGQSLLKVVGIGVDVVDKMFQVNSSCNDSPAVLVVELIKSSLNVLNEVLDRKPKNSDSQRITPLEETLLTHVSRRFSGESSEGTHLMVTISSYLYIKQDNEIPVLALELLRKLSILFPMSMHGSLGSKAKSLRDAFVVRITSITEDTVLKVGILDFLSAIVETQPGLVEVFFDVNETSLAEIKECKFGSNSCLTPVLANLSNKSPVPVIAASCKFLHSLWRNRRDMAMTNVKKSDKFWTVLSKYIMDDLPEDPEEMFICHVQIRSFVFQIIALELYYIKSGQSDPELKNVLELFETKQRYNYWADEVSNLTLASCSSTTSPELEETSLNFLRSWRTFLMVVAEVSADSVNDENVQIMILENTAKSIKLQFEDEINSHGTRIVLEKSSLFLMLIKKWIKAVQSPFLFIQSVTDILWTAHNADPKMLARLRTPLFSSLTLLLQHTRAERIVDAEDDCLISLLLLICEPLQYRNDGIESTTLQNKLLSVSLCLLNEVVTYIDKAVKWIQIFSEHVIFANIIQILDINLKKMENIGVVDAVLHFILSLSKYIEASEALVLNHIVQPLCLGMAELQKKLEQSAKQDPEGHMTREKWQEIWCLGVVVMAKLLGKLRYQFLKESLDFVAVHRLRIIQAMDLVRFNPTSPCLREAEQIAMFLVEMSVYRKEWQLALPDDYQQILFSSTVLLETCVSLLIRPRLLAYVIEKPSGRDSPDSSETSSASSRSLSHSFSSTSELLRPYSTPEEPLEKQNPKVVETQKTLLRIACNTLGFLKNFTPNICEILLDERMDIDEYTPLFSLTFSAPALDNEGTPSFGTLLSCLNLCLGYMQAADPRPLSSPDKSPWKFTALSSILPKSSVNFTMENSIILVLSQALLYLKDPRVEQANKQLLKRKLASELEPFLRGVMRHFGRRGYTPSPGSTPKSASSARRSLGRGRSDHWETGDHKDVKLIKLVDVFLKTMIQ
ncbi:nucleoporin NUP188 homolog isoform X2 [Dendronephthya gigantea]|uniref:nucleoporin NUP188 homolog isoform X2 n=1 Tax=Dendronephthya gigantea TaxID=151771 RepID=UPI00106A7AD2|nr:nucleoporin NUP188 homolog isoform X2 [Dendronephthya gigantea]